MSNVEKKSEDRNVKYIVLFILILFTGLGIWKCSNLSKKESKFEIALEKEDSLGFETSVKSDTGIVENTPSPTKSEIKKFKEADKSTTLKLNEESNPGIHTNKKNEGSPETQVEESMKIETKKEDIIPIKDLSNDEAIVYKVNKSIDKRLPATSDNQCKATSIFKMVKPTFQVSVAFSPDGINFAVGNLDGYVSIMDMEGKELLKLVGHKESVQSIKYSPDGRIMVTGSGDHTAKLWNASNGKEIRSLEGHTDDIFCVAYSPNGKYIATTSLDYTTILWDAKSGNKLFQLRGHKSEVIEATFSNNSKLIITGSTDETAKIWDVRSGEILYSLEGHGGTVSGIVFTPDDKFILTGGSDKKIRLWDAKTGKHMHTIKGHKAGISSMKISHDGKNILSASLNGLIKVWKIKGGKELCDLEGHTARIREAAFHPINKNTVVSVGNDNTIRMWKFNLSN